MSNPTPLDDESKARLYERLRRPDVWDRCHRYGWVITLVGTLIMQFVVWGYTVGSFRQSVDDMRQDFGARISRLEAQLDKVLER